MHVDVVASADLHRHQGRAAQGARPMRLFEAIGRASLRGHSCEVASHHYGPICLDSPTLGMTSREHAVAVLQVEQSVESTRGTDASRGVPSRPTASTSGGQREQPGEEQRAPFSDRLVHRRSRMLHLAAFERFRRALSVFPSGQRQVADVA